MSGNISTKQVSTLVSCCLCVCSTIFYITYLYSK